MYLSKEGKKLYKYYRGYEENFYLFLGKTIGGSNEEDIHGLRVTLKKLRGVIKLMSLLAEDFSSKEHFAQLRTLFKPAGNLRECQVNLKRLKDFEGYDVFYSAYKKARKTCMKHHRQSFDLAITSLVPETLKQTSKAVKRQCKNLSKEGVYIKSNDFIQNRIQKINKLHKKAGEDIENVHQIRIKLKEISTVLGLLHTMRPKKIPLEKIAELKKQEDIIGLWHDYAVLQESIDEFVTQNPKEVEHLMIDIKELQKAISVREAEFMITLDDFVEQTIAQIEEQLIPVSDTIEKHARISQPLAL